MDLLLRGVNHRTPDAPVNEAFIPGSQLESSDVADLEGKDFTEIEVFDCSPQVIGEMGGLLEVVFHIDEGDMIPCRCVDYAMIQMILVSGWHLRNLKYQTAGCKELSRGESAGWPVRRTLRVRVAN